MNKKSIAVIALSGLIGIGCLAGCSNNNSVPADRQKITFWGIPDQYNGNSFKEMVDAYNKGQGAIDGVWVSYLPKSDTSSDHVNTCTSKKPTVDVIGVSDRYTFNNIAQGFYTNLQPYVDDTSTYTTDKNGKKLFDVNNYASNNIDRYRFNVQTKEAGKGEDLYMLPMLNNATVLYYNETQFINNNINIISVPEEELDAYNATNGTSYAPRGYAEYTVAASPETNLKTSVNLQGQTVVKVFNNCIPMSFLETNTLSKNFSKAQNTKSSTKYGILNEWWFSHGWAVGGDCVKWDEDANQYKFTLGEEAKNYLVTSEVTINGVLYQPGEILTYRDKKTVQGGAEHLYELPSQYEQFREFCAWSQKKGVAVDDELSGYEISPSPATLGNTSKATYFTSSEVAMLVEDLSAINVISNAVGSKFVWNVAPLYTYREFEGEAPEASGVLKVIDGNSFKGEVKEVEGTPIVGKLSGSSINTSYAIPANSANKDEAWKFLQYISSAEGQSFFAKNDNGTPTSSLLINSPDYYNKANKKCSNYRAISIMGEKCEIGDWSYFENGAWIKPWSDELNTDVRNGVTSMDDFFAHQQANIDNLLKTYKFKLHGKE